MDSETKMDTIGMPKQSSVTSGQSKLEHIVSNVEALMANARILLASEVQANVTSRSDEVLAATTNGHLIEPSVNGEQASIEPIANSSKATSGQVITQLETLLSRSDDLTAGSETERLRVLKLCGQLTSQFERPLETFFKFMMSTSTTQIAVRVAVDWGLFKVLGPVSSEPKATDLIAAACAHNPDAILVSRILRHLAAVNVIREISHELYAATAFSEALTTEHFQGAVKYVFDDCSKIPFTVPSFLAETGYRNPDNILDTAGTRALGIKTPIYEWFNTQPHVGQHFGGLMMACNEGRPDFWDPTFYPVRERLGGATSEDEVLLVDIAGGEGNDLARFRSAFPDLQGRLILQELAHIVDRMSDKSFEAMEHDWNKPQPIKGARAYMLGHAIHTFSSDEKARTILQNVIPAMKPGWSKLLIKDNILPNTGAHFSVTGQDLGIMQAFAGRERTEAEWRMLLESVGLQVEAIYTHERSDDGVIECVLGGELIGQ